MSESETAPEAAPEAVGQAGAARARAADLLKVTSRLIGVLEREIDMLRAMRPREMQGLQEEKIVLVAAYEAQHAALADHPELVEALPAGLRGELAEATRRFRETLAQNERALRAAKQATDGLLRTIAEAVEAQRPAAGYGAGGASAATGGGRRAVALSLDERL